MKGASAAAHFTVAAILERFSGVAAYEFFFNAEATVDTLKYQVDTQENVTEVGRTQGQAVLNSMFCGEQPIRFARVGEFTVKRNEVKDADEVKFVEGIPQRCSGQYIEQEHVL